MGNKIYLYDRIDDDSSAPFIDDLTEASESASVVELHINSPGGDVFAGNLMANAIENNPVPVDAYIDGIAASMASVLAMKCRKVYIAANAMIMIHNPSGGEFGESRDLRRGADLLDKIKGNMMETYMDKTTLEQSQVSDMMDAGTWMTAQEAKQYGFADEVIGKQPGITGLKAIAQAKPKYDELLEQFEHKLHKMDFNTEIPKLLGLKKATSEQIIAEIKRLKLIEREADEATPGTVAYMVSAALDEGVITAEAQPELNAMGTGNPDVLRKYLDRLRVERSASISNKVDALFVRYADRINNFTMSKRASLRKLAEKDPESLEDVLSAIPAYRALSSFIIDGDKDKKSKGDWTLEDYRKHAPAELEANAALYQALLSKTYNKNS